MKGFNLLFYTFSTRISDFFLKKSKNVWQIIRATHKRTPFLFTGGSSYRAHRHADQLFTGRRYRHGNPKHMALSVHPHDSFVVCFFGGWCKDFNYDNDYSRLFLFPFLEEVENSGALFFGVKSPLHIPHISEVSPTWQEGKLFLELRANFCCAQRTIFCLQDVIWGRRKQLLENHCTCPFDLITEYI